MKKLLAAVALALAVSLAGCSAPAPEPEPTREFVLPDLDTDGWSESTEDEFLAVFPDLGGEFVELVPEGVYQSQGESWTIGTGTVSGGFAAIDSWARENFDVTDDGDNREALVTTDHQLVQLSYRAFGDGAIVWLFVSE